MKLFLALLSLPFLSALLFQESAALWASDLTAGETHRIEQLRSAGKYAEAIRLLEARTTRGATPATRMLLGQVYMDADRFRDAVGVYEPVCSRISDREPAAQCWNQFGVANMGLKRYREAERCFRMSLSKRKSGKATSRVYSNLALALFHRRKNREAKYAHQKAVQRDGDNLIALMNYGVFLGHFNRYRDAMKIFQDVLAKQPDYYFAHLHLGYVYYRLRSYHKALRQYNQGLRLKDDDFELYFYRAHAYYKLGASAAALRDLDKADKLKPGNTRTRVPRAFFTGRSRYRRPSPYRRGRRYNSPGRYTPRGRYRRGDANRNF